MRAEDLVANLIVIRRSKRVAIEIGNDVAIKNSAPFLGIDRVDGNCVIHAFRRVFLGSAQDRQQTRISDSDRFAGSLASIKLAVVRLTLESR